METPASAITIREYSKKSRGWIGFAAALLVVINLLDVSLTLIIARFVDEVSGAVVPEVITWCAIAYLSSATIQCVCRVSWRVLLGRIGTDLSERTRFAVALRAIRNPKQDATGTAVSLTQSDAENFSRALDSGVIISMDAAVNIIMVPIVLFYLNPDLAWKVLLPLPFITLLARRMDRKVGGASRAVQERLSDMTGIADEFVSHAHMIKANTLEETCTTRFALKSEEFRDANKKLIKLESVFGPGLESFISLSLISLMVFGIPGASTGAISIGTFLAFHRYVEYLQWPMRAVALALTTFRRSVVSGERMRNFVRENDEEITTFNSKQGALPLVAVNTIRMSYSSDVADERAWIIKPASLSAIIGPVGSGKSTLVRRLVGIESSLLGDASINGEDLTRYSAESLRRVMTLVPQEAELFGLTIRENLLLGAPSNSAVADHELWRTLSDAAIEEEVRKLPQGLDTVIGERGVTLSGGQRQRLSLARALMRKPQVLLLDNSLAATDGETERTILDNLRRLGVTVVCVTHRLSTVAACDETVVVNGGYIEAVVPTRELLAAPQGWANHFVESQRRELAAIRTANELVSEKGAHRE